MAWCLNFKTSSFCPRLGVDGAEWEGYFRSNLPPSARRSLQPSFKMKLTGRTSCRQSSWTEMPIVFLNHAGTDVTQLRGDVGQWNARVDQP